jgi:hypothetical protein
MTTKQQLALALILLGWAVILGITCGAEGQPDSDPCWYEKQNARSVCRALGRNSRECVAAVNDYKLCRAVEQPSDPIGGIE